MNDKKELKIGSIVQDPYGRIGIVCSFEPDPQKSWIKDQLLYSKISKLDNINWLGVMPLKGGYVLFPEEMLIFLRMITYKDFIQAADHAGPPSREALVKLFPEFINRLLTERKIE